MLTHSVTPMSKSWRNTKTAHSDIQPMSPLTNDRSHNERDHRFLKKNPQTTEMHEKKKIKKPRKA